MFGLCSCSTKLWKKLLLEKEEEEMESSSTQTFVCIIPRTKTGFWKKEGRKKRKILEEGSFSSPPLW